MSIRYDKCFFFQSWACGLQSFNVNDSLDSFDLHSLAQVTTHTVNVIPLAHNPIPPFSDYHHQA